MGLSCWFRECAEGAYLYGESHERIQDGSERNAPKKIVHCLCKLLLFAIICD
jgi:hypothetical protein